MQQASEEGQRQDADALEKPLQGLQQHQAALDSAGLCLDTTAPLHTRMPADGKLVRLANAVTLGSGCCSGLHVCLLRHGCSI